MVEADATWSLVTALEEGADRSRLASLLSTGDLGRVFPAIGIPPDMGLRCLQAVSDDAAAERTGDERQVIRYFSELLRGNDDLAVLLRELRALESSLLAAACAAAGTLLPSPLDPRGLRLVVLPIGLDFRTERDTVYMDPVAAVALGLDGIRLTLAHELHHIGRYRLPGQNLTLMAPDPLDARATTRDVFRDWATWLEAEGIADCVSNVTQWDVPPLRGIIESRRRQMDEYATLLRRALARVRDQSAKPATGTELESLKGDLRSLAHPIGFRMAERILSKRGRAALVASVGQPRGFLENCAASAPAGTEAEVEPSFIEWLDAD